MAAFHPSSEDSDKDFSLLCPVRALKVYLDKTSHIRKHHNLFLSYAPNHMGYKVSSQSISRWIRDTICHAYRQADIQIPRSSIKAHSTRAVAASLADIKGVSPRDLCTAALWSSSNVFAKFYRLDLASNKSISNQVLSQAISTM